MPQSPKTQDLGCVRCGGQYRKRATVFRTFIRVRNGKQSLGTCALFRLSAGAEKDSLIRVCWKGLTTGMKLKLQLLPLLLLLMSLAAVASEKAPLRAGAARVDITPTVEDQIPLAGYD